MISNGYVSNWQGVSARPVVVRDLPSFKHAFGVLFDGAVMTATRIDGTTPGSHTWSPPV